MTTPNDLDLVPTERLIEELLNRHAFGIFAGMSHDSDPNWVYTGPLESVLGFLEMARYAMIEDFFAPCEHCENGDGCGNSDGE